jgi:hypothetical protein
MSELMKRVSLDTATPAVKKFVRSLPIGGEGVELELDGKVVCEVVAPRSISPAERASLIARAKVLAELARSRNKGVPARVIEREGQDAVDEVRRRKQR